MTIRVRADSRKRPRVVEDSDDEEPLSRKTSPTKRARNSYTPSSSSEDDEGTLKYGPRTALSHIEIAPLIGPKSSYLGWKAPAPEASEADAIEALLKLYQKQQRSRPSDSSDDEHVEFEISNFTIYQSREYYYMGRDNEPTIEDLKCTLDTFRSKKGITSLYLDAVISLDKAKYFLRRVPFDTISVEGYGDLDLPGASGIYLQTLSCKKYDIWLRLGEPSAEYLRFHNDFLWVADFGKHVADYMLDESEVSLVNFKAHFRQWLIAHHSESPAFQKWLQSLRSSDFRVAFNRHMQWLWSEALSDTVDTDGQIRQHPIWSEVDHDGKWLTAIPFQNSPLPEDCKTIVTPYVFECFKDMYFGSRLQKMKIKDYNMRGAHHRRKLALGFANDRSRVESNQPAGSLKPPKTVRLGDVVGVPRDVDTKWQSKGSIWYLYVKDIQEDEEGPYYQGIWLYEPQDTTMGNMSYPELNELFLSDNCNCDEVAVRKSDIVAHTKVSWSPSTIPTSTHFVRQTYITSDQSFCSLRDEHLTCACRKPVRDDFDRVQQEFGVHDTVLVITTRKGVEILEPRIIDGFNMGSRTVRVRRLLRAKRDHDCADARPNDLVWTTDFLDIKPKRIMRKCNIRFLLGRNATMKRPDLYDRNGQADCFLITKILVRNDDGAEILRDLSSHLGLHMKQGSTFGTPSDKTPLAALSLFCGGGNFDRGLEDAGAIRTKWAVEWAVHAAHTYRANLSDPAQAAIFMGSVDEHIRRALAGDLGITVPAIGKVDILLAGSPCQGFSNMQPQKMSIKSLTNASKVATVASYIDLWRPKYAILENVPEMTRQVGSEKQENVFSQLLCCLVGMGYQVQQLLMDSWSYGEAQSRPRLFIIACAPGLPLLPHPNMTHAHPEDMPGRSLGKAPNGQPFGLRYYEPTTYPFVTAEEVSGDLPDISDGATHSCVAWPDHRPGKIMWPLEQELIRLIPKSPRNQGLVSLSRKLDKLPKRLRNWISRQSEMRLSRHSHSYKRLSPGKLFRTITTGLEPADAKAGYGIHWEQNRVLTVMEGRRAQGFLDHEVIIGNIATQWKIIGNSVSRAVALALGMSLRQAWLSAPAASTDHRPTRRADRQASPLVVVSKQTSARKEDCVPTPKLPKKSEYIFIDDDDDEPSNMTSSTSEDSVIARSTSKPNKAKSTSYEVADPATQQTGPDVKIDRAFDHSSLALRLSQTASGQLPSMGSFRIVELDSEGHTRHDVEPTPKFAPFTANRPSVQAEHAQPDKQLGRQAISQPSRRLISTPSKSPTMTGFEDDDEVIFVRSQAVRKMGP